MRLSRPPSCCLPVRSRLTAPSTNPLLVQDPWCVPANASRIMALYPGAERVDLPSGHCPHDDTPDLVIPELQRWVAGLRQA